MTFRFALRQPTPLEAAQYYELLPLPAKTMNLTELTQEFVASSASTYWVAVKETQILAIARTTALGAGQERMIALDHFQAASPAVLAAFSLTETEVLTALVNRALGDIPALAYAYSTPNIAKVLLALGFSPRQVDTQNYGEFIR